MYIRYHGPTIERICIALFDAPYGAGEYSLADNVGGGYRPDILRALKAGRTNSDGVKNVIATFAAFENPETVGVFVTESESNIPENNTYKVKLRRNAWLFGMPLSSRMVNAVFVPFRVDEIRSRLVSGETEPTDTTLRVEMNENIAIIRPSEAAVNALPNGARPFAVSIIAVETGGNNPLLKYELSDSSFTGSVIESNGQEGMTLPTEESILTAAREAYRSWLRHTLNRPTVDHEAIERQRQARAASAERFRAYAARARDEVEHVPTLPFVPHGLSSSRRWGIEVESGGARGVEAPAGWRRISDGSLRSAWDGYEEVQDFEPYDETVLNFTRPGNCVNATRHVIEERYYNSLTGRNDWRMRQDYIDPAQCENCGNTEEVIHRVPQTITHRRQDDDCAEFVSPILVSMHSNGLQGILNGLKNQPQNDSAGVHVHVEADDLTDAQVATLIFGYDILEPILEASYRRNERRYCNRREASVILETARKLRPGQKISQSDVRGGNRYVTLNTTALNDHGTIEFRAMGPVYDYDYLVRWAMLCRELVNLAKAGVTTKQFSRIKSWNDLTMLLAEHGKEYIRAVVYEATGETGHAADLLKQNEEVTTEALDLDLQNLLQGAAAASNTSRASLNRMAEAFNRLSRTPAELVSVGTVRTGTWMQ